MSRGGKMKNENDDNDLLGENDLSHRSGTLDKYQKLRQEIQQLSQETGKTLPDLTVLSRGTDPYTLATPDAIKRAIWAYNLWKECIETTNQNEIHTRGLHYFIVMKKKESVYPPNSHPNLKWSIYENTITCYNYLKEALEVARYFGLVPYESIVDQKNDVIRKTIITNHNTELPDGNTRMQILIDEPVKFNTDLFTPDIEIFNGPFDEYLEKIAENYADFFTTKTELWKTISFDLNLIKPFHIELWSEKTLPKYIKQIEGIDVIVEGSGEISITLAREFIETLNNNNQDGVILYISDFDPAGNDMPVSIARKLQVWKRIGDLKQKAYLIPIFLTKEQVIEYELPQIPISDEKRKNLGSAALRFDKKAIGFTELQAMEVYPDIYKDIIKKAVDKWNIDYFETQKIRSEKIEEIRQEIKQNYLNLFTTEEKQQLKKWFDNTVSLAVNIENELPDFDDIEKECERVFERIYDNNNYNKDITRKLREKSKSLTINEIVPPMIKKDAPIECLYDSNREDMDQTMILKKYKKLGDWR